MKKYKIDNISKQKCSEEVQLCYNILKDIHAESVADKLDDDTWGHVYERNFIINLAYYYGKKIESLETNNNASINLISGEIAKHITIPQKFKDKIEKLKNTDSIEDITVFPDFILHSSYNISESFSGQHLILEAKSKCKLSQAEFDWDLIKLIMYIERLNFRNAIYLIIGMKICDILGYFNNLQEEVGKIIEDENNIDKIRFIIKESIDDDPKIYQISLNI